MGTIYDITKYPSPAILSVSYRSDDVFDAMQSAYQAEYDRWDWREREKARGSDYELVRNSSPDGMIIDDRYMEVITFTRREAHNIAHIENWLETYRGRAAMRAALKVYGGPDVEIC